MRLSKEEFVDYVNTYRNICERAGEIHNALGICGEFYLDKICDEYYRLLENMCDFPDTEFNRNYGSDLNYYCHELNFGYDYCEECYMINGEIIPLKSAEDCWNVITKKNNKEEK